MKKTHSANIGGTIFNVEEDAYSRLATYLNSIETHFRAYPDSKDIVADIEGRIAEQLLYGKSEHAQKIATLADVERVIAIMGLAEEFDDTGNTAESPVASRPVAKQERKLFRDEDDRIIAGVASGLAAYFGFSVLLTRLFLIFLLFIGGASIFIYLLLWVLVPKAKTTTDKLRMRGDPVTLEAVERGVRNSIGSISPVASSSASRLAVMIGSGIRAFVFAIAWIVGIALFITAVSTVLALTIGLVSALSNPTLFLGPDGTGPSTIPGGMYYPLVICTYLICAIPFLTLIMFAINSRRGKKGLNTKVGIGMLVLFLVSLFCWGTIWANSPSDQGFPLFGKWTTVIIEEDGYPEAIHPAGHRITSIDTTVQVEGNPTIDLSLVRGRIQVNTWERNEVRIVATAGNNRHLDLLLSPARIQLYDRKTKLCPSCYGKTVYELMVPKGSTLKTKSVTGDHSITVDQGTVRASSVSGDIEVFNAREVHGENVSGDMYVQSVSGRVQGNSVSGDIRVMLPDTIHATIHANRVSGEISSDFSSNTAQSSFPDRSVRIPINGGGTPMNLETVSGDISIKKMEVEKKKER